jgi:D-xylose reductase
MESPPRNLRRDGIQCEIVSFNTRHINAYKRKAIKTGYRLFDGAYDYQNEKEAGDGIRKAIADGLVKREDIFITTKLWNNYHRKEHAVKMAKSQNDAWGLGYIDLFLIHFPCALEYVDPEVRRYPVRFSQ